jgi:Ca2+-binding EF-hand superfamily protein
MDAMDPEDLKELREAFDTFGNQEQGVIDEYELKVAMRALGFLVRSGEVKQIMEARDECTGKLDFAEFTYIMARKIADRDLDEEFESGFQLFDTDGSGKISFDNLCQVADEIGEDIDGDELRAMVNEFDHDKDGLINKFEFLDIMKQSQA